MSEFTYPQIPYSLSRMNPHETLVKAENIYRTMNQRRSCRHFSADDVPREVIENLIATAGSAPSGANRQPWFFVAVHNAEVKKKIRVAAEKEEKAFYEGRASDEWLEDLKPLGTTWEKPFLEEAPWLIVVFKKAYDISPVGKKKNYYVQESVGLACGFLISAIHRLGLVTLTHTPSPMDFLGKILHRPENEKPFLLLPVGYPADEAMVPDIGRKPLNEIAAFLE